MLAKQPRLPPAPQGLSQEAKRVWREVARQYEMDPTGWLLLRAGLEMWDSYVTARSELARAGAVTTTHPESGHVHAHPAAKVATDALRECRQVFRQLGLEPPE